MENDLIRRGDALNLFKIHGMVVQRDFKDIPAVDAVEVVRCRECAVPHNAATGCPLLLGIRVDPDFYCKFGYRETRKDGDGHG